MWEQRPPELLPNSCLLYLCVEPMQRIHTILCVCVAFCSLWSVFTSSGTFVPHSSRTWAGITSFYRRGNWESESLWLIPSMTAVLRSSDSWGHTLSSRWVTPGTKMGALPVQACPESLQSPVMLRAQLVTILWMIQIIRRNSGWFFSHGKVPSKLRWCWPPLAFRVNRILTHHLSPGCWTVSHQFPSLFWWGNQGWE